MKIALLGYGKMGKAIENIAVERGHHIGVTIDNEEEWMGRIDNLRQCDIAIDFSTPSTAVDNILKCFNIQIPIVVGTTGWYDHLDTLVHDCQNRNAALFVASNFSIGMNIMFTLNHRLAQLMDSQPDYRLSITETHHIHKLDAPSGTAISLAKDIAAECHRYSHLDSIPIESIRQGEVPGIHEVVYDSDIDTITLSHSAKSRKGLALGAVLAAEYLVGKTGYYTMQDLLNL